ncbi:MAG: hypothetical protein OEZ16_05650 [Chromatiales bacterium]|nr:hypothetical protein [Chromatiales bacterium]
MKLLQYILYAFVFLSYGGGTIASWTEPDITDSKVDTNVTYNSETGIYTYMYTVTNPSSSFASVKVWGVDVSPASVPTSTEDKKFMDRAGLVSDERLKRDYSADTGKSLALGVETPIGWESVISVGGDVTWMPAIDWGQPIDYLSPGEVLGSFVLHSRVPPGATVALLKPKIDMGEGSPYEEYGELCGEENSPCPDPKTFWVKRTVIGPVLPSERVLIDGKGQRSSDVNTFLRYANPTDSTTVSLPVNTTSYPLAVVFGSDITPASFSATLNGVDIGSQFNVAAGITSVVNLPLTSGRNTLVLSLDGLRADGRTATDTDRLVFIIK